MSRIPNKMRTYNRTKHRQKTAEALAMKEIKKQELLIKIKANMKYILFISRSVVMQVGDLPIETNGVP